MVFFFQRRNLGLALYVHMNVQADPKPLYIPMLTLKSWFFFFVAIIKKRIKKRRKF